MTKKVYNLRKIMEEKKAAEDAVVREVSLEDTDYIFVDNASVR